MAHIPPTVGRMVLFWPRRDDNIAKQPNQPLAAVIAAVCGPSAVSLCVFDVQGVPHGYTDIVLIQEDEARPLGGDFAEWMPYQKGQAAKTETAERVAAAAASKTHIV
jgi:hypothetical protein